MWKGAKPNILAEHQLPTHTDPSSHVGSQSWKGTLQLCHYMLSRAESHSPSQGLLTLQAHEPRDDPVVLAS